MSNASATTLSVRLAGDGDRDFVLRLAARFSETRAPWRGDDEVAGGTRRQLAAAFETPREGDTLLIAVNGNGARAGFAYVVTHEDFFTGEPHGHISELAATVDGNGAGRVLLAACEAWSRARGFRYLSLNVNDANAAARAFYARHSFEAEYRHLVKLL